MHKVDINMNISEKSVYINGYGLQVQINNSKSNNFDDKQFEKLKCHCTCAIT